MWEVYNDDGQTEETGIRKEGANERNREIMKEKMKPGEKYKLIHE